MGELERESLRRVAFEAHRVRESLARRVVERVRKLHPRLDERDRCAQPRARQHDPVLGVEHDEQVRTTLDEDGIETVEHRATNLCVQNTARIESLKCESMGVRVADVTTSWKRARLRLPLRT